jgi:hypothetical protein
MADYQADIPPVENGGFVESEGIKVKEMTEVFPVTITVYLGTHTSDMANQYVKIANVHEDSITMEVRKGIPTLVCESMVTDRIAYIPNAVWYTTEIQSGIQA